MAKKKGTSQVVWTKSSRQWSDYSFTVKFCHSMSSSLQIEWSLPVLSWGRLRVWVLGQIMTICYFSLPPLSLFWIKAKAERENDKQKGYLLTFCSLLFCQFMLNSVWQEQVSTVFKVSQMGETLLWVLLCPFVLSVVVTSNRILMASLLMQEIRLDWIVTYWPSRFLKEDLLWYQLVY